MKSLPTKTKRLPCQVCGRLLAVTRDGLTRYHLPYRGAEDACRGFGYRHDRWPVGQLLRHHSSGVWVVEEVRRDGYLIRCPDGSRSIFDDKWLEEPGSAINAHAEYMHRHGWTPIGEST